MLTVRILLPGTYKNREKYCSMYYLKNIITIDRYWTETSRKHTNKIVSIIKNKFCRKHPLMGKYY